MTPSCHTTISINSTVSMPWHHHAIPLSLLTVTCWALAMILCVVPLCQVISSICFIQQPSWVFDLWVHLRWTTWKWVPRPRSMILPWNTNTHSMILPWNKNIHSMILPWNKNTLPTWTSVMFVLLASISNTFIKWLTQLRAVTEFWEPSHCRDAVLPV